MSFENFPDKLMIGKSFNVSKDIDKLFKALQEAEGVMNEIENNVSKVRIIFILLHFYAQ